jgi:hypothetical protein
METLVIRSKSKKNIKLLFEIAQKIGEKPVIESQVEQSIDRGLKEVKAILSGEKKAKSLDELLDE